MKTKFYFISILFVALVSTAGFFTAPESAEAFAITGCTSCGYDTYDPGYYGGGDYYGGGSYYGFDDYYFYEPYDNYYYYEPVFYQPPVYIPPVLPPTPPAPPNPPTCSLSATQTSVTAGTPVTLSWTAGNATAGSITAIGSVSPSFGSRVVNPQVTTTYIGTFTGQGGSITCQTTVVVQPKTPPTCSLIATPGAINRGDTASLSWSTSGDVTSMHITNVGSVSASGGSRVVSPTVSTTYVATVSGPGGSATCQAPVTVIHQPQQNAPTCTLSISQNNFNNFNNFNNPATIFWTTNNATSINISNIGNVNTGSGSRTIFPGSGTQTYVATVTGPGGSATCQATTHNIVQSAPWCTLTVSSNFNNTAGTARTITWNTSSNANSFFISNVGNVNTGSGSRTIFPNTSTTYTGTVTNFNGQTATCQTTIGVTGGPNVSLFQQPGDQPLAFVSLSQVPYTGFEAGTILTFLFWFAVALWSFGLAYIFMGKRGIQFIAERVFAFDTSVGSYQSVTADTNTVETREDEYVNGHDETEPALQSQMTVAAPQVAPAATYSEPTTDTATPSFQEIVESRAHASGVLMSPEATVAAEELHEDQAEALKIFGEILNEAVRTLPREDGWILLSSDRFEDLANGHNGGSQKIEEPEITKGDLEV